MVQNKEKIAQLESQLKGSGAKNANLNKLIAGLNKQIETQAAEIERLNGVLAKKTSKSVIWATPRRRKHRLIHSVQNKNQHKANYENFNRTKWRGFYIIGSKSWKKKALSLRRRLFSAKKIMANNYESELFTQVNITQLEEIPLMGKKAKVLTNHPKNSYSLNADANNNLTLVIKNKADFWSVSIRQFR